MRILSAIFGEPKPGDKNAESLLGRDLHKIDDPEKLAAYAKLAGPALIAAGAKFLARGMPAKVYENGVMERTVIQEWASVEAAIKGHDTPGYQEALKALGDGCEREIGIVEAAE